jgi:hypothetical protein
MELYCNKCNCVLPIQLPQPAHLLASILKAFDEHHERVCGGKPVDNYAKVRDIIDWLIEDQQEIAESLEVSEAAIADAIESLAEIAPSDAEGDRLQ